MIVRIQPGPGQESVWDYPRPPRVEASGERVVVRLGGFVLVDTRNALRVLETSHPPAFSLPRSPFAREARRPAGGSSVCEYKGLATYLDVQAGGTIARRSGWT